MTYAGLLTSLLAMLLFFYPLSAAGYSYWAGYVFGGAVLVAAGVSAAETRMTRRVVAVLLTIAFCAEIAAGAFGAPPIAVARIASGAFLVYVAIVVLRDVVRREQVDADAILGAVCFYLLAGYCFYSAFAVVELVSPGAFQDRGHPIESGIGGAGHFPILLYYSFTTLTTLGYGDVTPVHPLARSLASVEAVAGPLYLAILVARLVGAHLSQDRSSR